MRVALLVLFVIAITGCTSLITNSTGPGITIEVFGSDFSTVYAGEETVFDVRFSNTGSVDANTVHAQIFGLEEWSGTAWVHLCDTTKLLAANPTAGTGSQTKTCSYKATAPDVPRGTPITYQPTLRIYYKYYATVVQDVTIGTIGELRRVQNQGVALPAKTTVTSTGPITLTLENNGPIRVIENSVTFPVTITVTNNGDGTACNPDCSQPENWNTVVLTIVSDAIVMPECTKIRLPLFKGQSNTIVCELTVEHTDGIIQKPVQVHAFYSYFTDKSISITVDHAPS